MTDFIDSYYIWVKFVRDNGEVYEEVYENMSLSDFEVLYGKWTDNMIDLRVTLT